MTPSSTLGVNGGWFVGFNYGEFGGSLWWFSADGNTAKKISNDNVVDIVKTKSGILVIAGLCHLDCRNGKIFRLDQVMDGWERHLILDMKSAPAAHSKVDDDTYLVASHKNVYRIHGSGRYETLMSGKSELTQPRAIVQLNSGEIVLGMDHYVMVLAPEGSGYKEYWFSPKDCPRFTDPKPGYDSGCRCFKK